MLDETTLAAIAGTVDPARVLELEQALIRIPSSTFREHDIADYLAGYLEQLGLQVKMMPVPHPFEPGIVSRQPIARLAGTGGGLMLMTPVASVEALIVGVKVRCRVVVRDRHGRLVAKVFSPNGVDIAAGPYRPD